MLELLIDEHRRHAIAVKIVGKAEFESLPLSLAVYACVFPCFGVYDVRKLESIRARTEYSNEVSLFIHD